MVANIFNLPFNWGQPHRFFKTRQPGKMWEKKKSVSYFYGKRVTMPKICVRSKTLYTGLSANTVPISQTDFLFIRRKEINSVQPTEPTQVNPSHSWMNSSTPEYLGAPYWSEKAHLSAPGCTKAHPSATKHTQVHQSTPATLECTCMS